MTGKTASSRPAVVKKISLALQGGGAHGAFTWGVLDRLLEEERVEIEGISATSGGAMSAAILSYGLAKGGRKKARQLLEKFWNKLSHAASLSPLQPTLLEKMLGNSSLEFSPSFIALDYLTRIFSPYQFNLFDINPLRDVLKEVIDFELLRKEGPVKLFVNATNVRTGKVKIFAADSITLDVLLAAACQPFIFKTVEIDGEYYWDGGFSGNPALFPLIRNCESKDIAIIQVTPLTIEDVPVRAPDILERVNEISFNANLMREMRAIAFASKLSSEENGNHGHYKTMFIHMLEAEDIIGNLGRASKINADWDFLCYLKETGRQVASDWLDAHFEDLGVKSTIDVNKVYV